LFFPKIKKSRKQKAKIIQYHKKVQTFFFLMAGSDKSHLNLLSKLAHIIHKGHALSWIHQDATHASILKEVLEWEKELNTPLSK
jgi:mannitol/fructose-specific phosphotransferase system IIA component (Ntr-type)